MLVRFLDVGWTYTQISSEVDEAIKRVLEGGAYILGSGVADFERNWATYCGAEFSVGVANGLEALELGLQALGIGPGDEVVVPANTYIATWLAVSRVGAKIIPVDPNPETLNIDVQQIRKKVGPRCRAVLAVHLFGHPCEVDELKAFCIENNIFLVEDAAQAHGASLKNKKIGGHGDVVCWSFYPGKNLGAFGDAGAVTTNNKSIAKKIEILRNYGSEEKYINEYKGMNSRLDPIQAAVLSVKLKYLDEWNEQRRKLASVYTENLPSDMRAPAVLEAAQSAHHLYVIQVRDRERLRQSLLDAGIETIMHYPIPPYKQKAYEEFRGKEFQFPITTKYSQSCLSLPIGPHLTEDKAKFVCDVINRLGVH